MCNRSQILKRMPLLLQWETLICRTDQDNLTRLKLKSLLPLRFYKLPLYCNRTSSTDFCNFSKILQMFFKNNLQILEIRTIIKLDKSKGFRVPKTSYPSIYQDLRSNQTFIIFIKSFNTRCLHFLYPKK